MPALIILIVKETRLLDDVHLIESVIFAMPTVLLEHSPVHMAIGAGSFFKGGDANDMRAKRACENF